MREAREITVEADRKKIKRLQLKQTKRRERL